MSPGDPVYLRGADRDVPATIVGALGGRLQVAIDTDSGTQLAVVYPRQCTRERRFSVEVRRSVIHACRTMQQRGQCAVALNHFELCRLLQQHRLSRDTSQECAALFSADEWLHGMAPLRRWLERIRSRYGATPLSSPVSLKEAA